jgi:molybdenum cofactor guanylyltransferase
VDDVRPGVLASQPLSAIVLVGGKGRRLGLDKTAIALPGQSRLVEQVIRQASQVACEVILVGGDGAGCSHLPVRLVEDARPGTGCLGGLYSGLAAATQSHCLALACDMPFLSVRLLQHMADQPRDYDVLVPRYDGYFEPLHAIYSSRCLTSIEAQLDAGDLRIVGFYGSVRVRCLTHDEMAPFDPDLLSPFNVNTPTQLEFATNEARRRATQSLAHPG